MDVSWTAGGWRVRAALLAAAPLLAAAFSLPAAPVAVPATGEDEERSARSGDVSLREFTSLDPDVRLDRIVAGGYDAQFLPAGDSARLRGGTSYTHWLRIETAPPQGLPGQDWLLHFERVPLDRITVYMPVPGRPPLQLVRRFFRSDPGEGVLPSGFVFPLPESEAGTLVLYASVQTRVPVVLSPRLLDVQAFHLMDRGRAALLSAVYAALLVLSLSSASLWLALRDRTYLSFLGFTVSLLLLLGAVNGHLYTMPGAWILAWWGPFLSIALSLLACAFALGTTQHFLALSRTAPRADRIVRIARWSLAGLALLALAMLKGLAPELLQLAALVWIGTGIACVLLAGRSAAQGQLAARGLLLIWVLVSAAVAVRALHVLGVLPGHFWTLHGWQLTLAVSSFLLSLALADRVMEFRKQRDRATLAHRQTDATLQVEQRRRELQDGLREALRSAPPGDLEWMAFRKLLATLRPLLPQTGSAIVAYGYHELDLLLAEPGQAKERFGRLLAVRGGNVKGVCRGRTAVQLTLEPSAADGADARGGSYAIVPLPISRPGWGALIVEREAGEPFSAEELRLASEFAHSTTAAADEAAAQAELRRRVELDPLTAAYNRRGGEQALEEAMAAAIDRRLPLTVMLVDPDQLKQVNARHGDAAGDALLREVADACRRLMQAGDLLVRHAPGQLLLVLPGRQPDQARQLGERLRDGLAQGVLRVDGALVKFTVCIGIAGRGGADDTPGPLVERSERALQSAKRNGRGQLVVAATQVGYGSSDDDPEGLVL